MGTGVRRARARTVGTARTCGGRAAHGPAYPPVPADGRGGAWPPAAMGVAVGMPGGGGAACPCAEGAVAPVESPIRGGSGLAGWRMASEKIE